MENNENIVTEKKEPIGKALASFIMAIVAVGFSASIILCVYGMILGIISLAFSNSTVSVKQQPYAIFRRVAKPASIAAIVVGAVTTTAFVIIIFLLALKGGTITSGSSSSSI